MNHFQHRTEDALAHSRTYSHEEWRVLAAAEGFPEHNPSLAQLAEATGMSERRIAKVQNSLSRRHERMSTYGFALADDLDSGVEFDVPPAEFRAFASGMVVWFQSPVILDRPEGAHERNPHNPRFVRSTKVAAVDAPRAPGKQTFIPQAILAKLRRGTGVSNASLICRVVAIYASEQLRRGAIQISDAVVAELIGADPEQVGKIRRQLIEDGALVHVRKSISPPIYTMPGATPKNPRRARDLDPQKTRDLRRLELGDAPFTVLASAKEWAKIHHLLDSAGAGHAWLVGEAILWNVTDDERAVPASAIITGLLTAAKLAAEAGTKAETRFFPAKPLQDSKLGDATAHKHPRDCSEAGGLYPLSLGVTSKPSTPTADEPAQTSTPGTLEEEQTVRSTTEADHRKTAAPEPLGAKTPAPKRKPHLRPGAKLRHFGGPYRGTQAVATDDEYAEMLGYLLALKGGHHSDEADLLWRDVLYVRRAHHKAQGDRILELLRARFGHLPGAPPPAPTSKQDQATTGTLDSLLADVFRMPD